MEAVVGNVQMGGVPRIQAMSKRISIVNQKGGVGKTTTVFNLGACLAERSYRVLLVDLDAQANLTVSFGLNPDEIELTSNNLLTEEHIKVVDVIRETGFENLHVVPADIRLAGAELKMKEMIMKEKVLEGKIAPVVRSYEFILFDCPPNLSTITINALVASSEAIIPIETQTYSLKAMDDLTNTFNLLKEKMGHKLRTYVLPTKIDRRVKLSMKILGMLDENFGNKLLNPIQTDANIARGPLIKRPLVYSFPNSRSTLCYQKVCDAILNHE